MSLLLANVALSDTFNTWRIRTNQIASDAASLSANNTFAANVTFSNVVTLSGNTNYSGYLRAAGTGQIKVPVGNNAQRIESTLGGFRYNSESNSFEGYGSDGWGSIGGGGLGVFKFVTAAYTANVGDRIAVDTTSANVTITLPAAPDTDSIVEFVDKQNTWAANYLIVNRNGNTIEGSADNLIADVGGANFFMQYDGSTWQVFGPSTGLAAISGVISGPYNSTTFTNNSITGLGYLQVNGSISGNIVTTTVTSNKGIFTGPVTAPVVTANAINGTSGNFTTLQADAIDFDGDLTVDNITANTTTVNGIFKAAYVQANTISGNNNLVIKGRTITLKNFNNNETMLTASEDGAISLYHDNAAKLNTTSAGVEVGGTTSSFLVAANTYTEKAIVQNVVAAATIDLDVGSTFVHTLDGNVTYTFSNPPASGIAQGFTLKLVQDPAGNSYTVTWPGSVKWAAQTAPTLSTAANTADVLVFFTHNAGGTYYGFIAGQDVR